MLKSDIRNWIGIILLFKKKKKLISTGKNALTLLKQFTLTKILQEMCDDSNLTAKIR